MFWAFFLVDTFFAQFDGDASADEVAQMLAAIEREIGSRQPRINRIFIEAGR